MTTTTTSCTSPISWLRLERYHLGELGAADRTSIAEHLASCDACTALFARIEKQEDEDLPPLRVPTTQRNKSPDRAEPIRIPPAPPAPATPITRARRFPWGFHPQTPESPHRRSAPLRRWYAHPRTMASVAGALALAALVVIAIGRRPGIPGEEDPMRDPVRIKGSEIAFTLVREDAALIAEAGGPYHDGERFKALVTCPPGSKAHFDVAVFEQGIASFPLDAPSEMACGNSMPLPGAFRVTGHTRMTVCLVWDLDAPVDRDVVRRTQPDVLLHAQCKILDPAF